MSTDDLPTQPIVDGESIVSPEGTDPSSTTFDRSHPPSLRTLSEPPVIPPNPLLNISAARRPNAMPFSPSSPAVPMASQSSAPSNAGDMQAYLARFMAQRKSMSGTTPTLSTSSPAGGFIGGALNKTPASPRMNKPDLTSFKSSPIVPGGPKDSLSKRRGLKLPGGLPPAAPSPAAAGKPNGDTSYGSKMDEFSDYVDKATGSLKFQNKAIIHSKGVDFDGGKSYQVSLDELESLDELGKGNYGTVYKVIHRKPRLRVPGAGVAPATLQRSQSTVSIEDEADRERTGVVMAMKEIRLELDTAKFQQIIMELDILHRCVCPYIIDFYGAFFQEGAVYICIEWMDGGSMDKLYGDGVPENVLKRVTWATIMGLKYLKEEHNIIHRDVKPTNVLVNTKGDVKLCDFGVSGNLVASIAKTNIGCQSYMAPERISSGGMSSGGAASHGTYSVQSDVWSLGLSILECAMGRYPYPPETYNNIFSQLTAIVEGEPPNLPEEGFSPESRDFVRRTLHKIPKMRPTYAAMLQHPWFADMRPDMTITEEDEESEDAVPQIPPVIEAPATRNFPEVRDWVIEQVRKRDEKLKSGGKWGSDKPALHSVALDKVVSPILEKKAEEVTSENGGEEKLVDGVNGLSVS